MRFLDFIIILAGACLAQIFFSENLLSDKFEKFINRSCRYSHETYKKIEDIVFPVLGAFIVLLFINPQTIIAQATTGLTWSTTIVAVYKKALKQR